MKSRTDEQKEEAHCTWTNCFVILKDLSNVTLHCACLHNGAKSKFKRKHCSPDWTMKRITHVMKRLKSLRQDISSYLSLSDAECTETLIIAVTYVELKGCGLAAKEIYWFKLTSFQELWLNLPRIMTILFIYCAMVGFFTWFRVTGGRYVSKWLTLSHLLSKMSSYKPEEKMICRINNEKGHTVHRHVEIIKPWMDSNIANNCKQCSGTV